MNNNRSIYWILEESKAEIIARTTWKWNWKMKFGDHVTFAAIIKEKCRSRVYLLLFQENSVHCLVWRQEECDIVVHTHQLNVFINSLFYIKLYV